MAAWPVMARLRQRTGRAIAARTASPCTNNRGRIHGRAAAVLELAQLAASRRDFVTARAGFEQCLASARRQGHRFGECCSAVRSGLVRPHERRHGGGERVLLCRRRTLLGRSAPPATPKKSAWGMCCWRRGGLRTRGLCSLRRPTTPGELATTTIYRQPSSGLRTFAAKRDSLGRGAVAGRGRGSVRACRSENSLVGRARLGSVRRRRCAAGLSASRARSSLERRQAHEC